MQKTKRRHPCNVRYALREHDRREMWIRQIVAEDVITARKHASVVYALSPDNQGGSWQMNDRATTQLVSIIGPGTTFGIHIEEAVLDEVGLFRSMPYERGYFRNDDHPRGMHVPRRWRICTLTKSQYIACAADILQFVQAQVNAKIARRTVGNFQNPYHKKVCIAHQRWSKGRKILLTNDRFIHVSIIEPCRVTVHEESWFRHDLDAAAVLRNTKHNTTMEKLARKIDMMLQHVPSPPHKPFRNYARVREIKRILSLSKLPDVWKAKIPYYLRNHPHFRHFDQLKGLIDIEVFTPQCLPCLEERIVGLGLVEFARTRKSCRRYTLAPTEGPLAPHDLLDDIPF
ncbi:MAG: hypothetical protein AAB343_01870 [Patescibacteria group bacterium]